jgi:hypothetical protein
MNSICLLKNNFGFEKECLQQMHVSFVKQSHVAYTRWELTKAFDCVSHQIFPGKLFSRRFNPTSTGLQYNINILYFEWTTISRI